MKRTFTEKTVEKTSYVFRLLKDTDKVKKNKKFDCYNGLVSGVVLTINGKQEKINFTNKEYFKMVIQKRKEKVLQCELK